MNYDAAERNYRGVQFTAEKRFSNNWNAQASYTYSRTRGNHFGDNFTPLGDYLDAQCRTTVDLTVGTNGIIPCAEVQNGANKTGAPTYDRPHNFKLAAAYVRPVGPVNLTFGALTECSRSSATSRRARSTCCCREPSPTPGNTATYFYNERGADPVEGMEWYLDTSIEGTWRIYSTAQAGLPRRDLQHHGSAGEAPLEQRRCSAVLTAGAGCAAAIANFGKATSRASYRGGVTGTLPRAYRFSMIFRF